MDEGKIKAGILGTMLLIVGGCGGEDGTGSAPVVTPPTVSPAPPSPSPSPSATASASALDFSQDLSFDDQLALSNTRFTYTDALGRISSGYIASEWLAAGQNASLIYRASPETVQFAFGGSVVSYAAGDRISTSPYRRYSRQGNELGIGWSDPQRTLRYVTAVLSRSPDESFKYGENNGVRGIERTTAFGYVSTVAAHIEGPLYYDGQPILAGGFGYGSGFNAGRTLFSVRSGNNQVSGRMILRMTENGIQVEKSGLTFTGTLDDTTNRITGTISDAITGYTGTFRGSLYGPEREELAIIFRFSNLTVADDIYSGVILAGR